MGSPRAVAGASTPVGLLVRPARARRASGGDAAELSLCYSPRDSWLGHRRRSIRRPAWWTSWILQQEASVTYVVEDPRHIAGWISVGRSRDPEVVPTTGELWAIYVAPADWGRGAGRALWDRGRAHLSESGFLDVTVWVLKDNRRALRFYEAAGFARDGQERPIEIGGASLPEIRLGCSLDAQRTVSR